MVFSEYIYLHGFASSPHGTKAQYLRECFEDSQINLTIPDLNQGDFFNLTLTRQLQFLETEYFKDYRESDMDNESVKRSQYITLIGSIFGGLISAILAQDQLQVKRLVILAPAFQFHIHLCQLLGKAKMQQWQTDRSLLFAHYGEKCTLPLNYKFWTDLVQYQDEKFSREIPTLILHGIHDNVIPIKSSREFASQRPWVEIIELESDHGLVNVLPDIWQEIQYFCQV